MTPLAGEQMVIDGEVILSVHWAEELPIKSSNTMKLKADESNKVLNFNILPAKENLRAQLILPPNPSRWVNQSATRMFM